MDNYSKHALKINEIARKVAKMGYSIVSYKISLCCSLADLGGVPGARPPYGTQFFCFCIHFCQKAPVSEVHAPQMGPRPPTGNPGSATAVTISEP